MDVEEDAPPSKFPRLERAIKITDVKLHSRLHIYDFVGFDFSLPYFYENYNYNHDPKDADDNEKMYGRMRFGAVVFGDLDAMQYLSEMPIRVDDDDDDDGDDDDYDYNEKEEMLDDMCYILGRNRHWKGLKWAVEQKYSTTGWTIGGAIRGGASKEMIQDLRSMGCLMDEVTFAQAVFRGDMTVIEWLRENQCPWYGDTFQNAASIGNRDILLWLRVEGCPWNCFTFSAAIDGGADLLTLKWLHHEKCPWNEYAMTAAVKRGDFKILRWLLEKQCPWDAECYRAAVEKKNGKVLQWLRQENCPWNETTVDLLFQNLESCFNNH